MSDGTYRGRWVDEIFRTPHVSAEVKVFLLYLERNYMDATGRVSEPRENLAKELNCHPRNITAKFKAAITGGLMEQTARGQKHRTAVYQAVVPGFPQGDGCRHPESDSQGAGVRHPENGAQGDDTRHPEASQGAGFYHPEREPQGAGFYHPETAQGDDSQHPEGSQGDGSHHPTYKRHEGKGDNGEVAEVISLFDEKTPPPAGADAPAAVRSQTPAQSVVAAYIEGVKDATGERPDRRMIGRISKQAKSLLEEENRDPERLAAAARSLGRKIGNGYTDLGQEFLMAAAGGHSSTSTAGAESQFGPRANVNDIDWSKGITLGGNRR